MADCKTERCVIIGKFKHGKLESRNAKVISNTMRNTKGGQKSTLNVIFCNFKLKFTCLVGVERQFLFSVNDGWFQASGQSIYIHKPNILKSN